MDLDAAFEEFIVVDEVATVDTDDEKENSSSQKRKHITNEQYTLMANFVQSNDRKAFNRQTYSELWNGLANELNKIGPPVHPTKKWRKMWSSYKPYQKSKPRRYVTPKNVLSEIDQQHKSNTNRELETVTVSLNIEPNQDTTASGNAFEDIDQSHQLNINHELETALIVEPNQDSSASGNALEEKDHTSTATSMQKPVKSSDGSVLPDNQFQCEVLEKFDMIISQQGMLITLLTQSLEQQQKSTDLLESILNQ